MHESVRQVKIMISSTRADLGQYREEASNIIKKVAAEKEKWIHLVEVSMEKETRAVIENSPSPSANAGSRNRIGSFSSWHGTTAQFPTSPGLKDLA